MIQVEISEISGEAAIEASLASKRLMHLVDVENLVGSTRFSVTDAAAIHAAYERVAPAVANEQIVVATSHHAALPTWFGWPASVRRLVRSGHDGADLALIEVIQHEAVSKRFEHVVIGSGDGIFAFAAARLQADGCGVTVVTRRMALSRELRLAVRDIRYIDPLPIASAVALSMEAA
jgi:hypothetical protein